MHRGRFIFTAALTLLTINAWAADPVTIVDLDFSRDADLGKVTINDNLGIAAVVEEGGKKRLRLNDGTGSQAVSVFTTTPVPVPESYVATFQFEVKRADVGLADGFAFVAQSNGPDKLGGSGGSIGYVTPDLAKSYAVEFNSYSGQGGQTVAWNQKGSRSKFDQSPFEHADMGIFTAEVRVEGSKITVTASGGSENMAPTQVMTTKFLQDLGCGEGGNFFRNLTPEPVYFGFTAGTGGETQITDIFNLKIVAPAPAPAATTPPTAGG
jgi:hypothetical protein